MRQMRAVTVNTDMRDAFFDELCDIAKRDVQVIFLTADMGAHSLNRFKNDLPRQYINMGVAEQNMVSVAAGLALGGKRVFIYTIIPFATLRCYEQIKIDLCCMNLPVTIIGVGPGLTYGSDGPTHHATSDIALMRALPEITILNPSDPVMTKAAANIAYRNTGPTYVRIDKGQLAQIYDGEENNFSCGLCQLSIGEDLTIIATGIMVHRALEVAKDFNQRGVSTGVIDLYRIKPLNQKSLLEVIVNSRTLVTLEENNIVGSLGSLISEVLSDNKKDVPLKRIAIPDEHCFTCGDRETLQAFYGLEKSGIIKTINEFLASVKGEKNGFRS